MSRSGYSDDYCGNEWDLICWRGAVASARLKFLQVIGAGWKQWSAKARSTCTRSIFGTSGNIASVVQRMSKRKKGPDVSALPVEAPAKILETHTRDRLLSAVAGSPLGWRNNNWPIRTAYENDRLATPSHVLSKEKIVKDKDQNTRWLAMSEYDEAYCQVFERTGRDSTDLDRVEGGGGVTWMEIREDAVKKLVSIDSEMSEKDRTIIRKLCEGYSLPGAVKAACGEEFVHAVAARVRDALDALDDAITRARENGFRYVKLDFEKSGG